MQRRQHTNFSTVQSSGAILPVDLLQRVALLDPALAGLTPESYHLLKTERLNEAINHSWNRLLGAWAIFKAARERLPEKETGTTLTRERWLLPLFSELGYGRLPIAKTVEVHDKSYPISHLWQQTPIHLVGCGVDLDHLTRGVAGAARSSPHSLVQELLNRSDSYLWGFVSNGLGLRLLRDNVSITRQAYVEFDLEEMMDGEVYADFVLLWLLCHESRVEAESAEECWLEKWSRTAQKEGTRVLDHLCDGVEQAIAALGSGFLAHPANASLRDRLRGGQLGTQDYYRQVLRIVYRLIVLFVAEDRDLLFHPLADAAARTRYTLYYSMSRLRHLAERRMGTRHFDLFSGLRLVMEKLGDDDGYPELGLPTLNSFLFSRKAIPDLADGEIANRDLLDAIRALAFTSDGHTRRVVDYRNLGPEELGSVYESLLELHPVLHIDTATFKLDTASGHERKTTGSYYTPTSLITSLLESALDPVLDEACRKADPEKAILNLKVCDPACGSGHFLIAAAHRIARKLAVVRTGEEEPPPEARRKALRDVIGRCIYGVDINPMSVELCKVNLWVEAIEPGKPLSFLEQHIQYGNSLLGATPALLADGIPDGAFEPIDGDDKKICSEYKKKNKQQRAGNRSLFDPEGKLWGRLATNMMQLEEMGEDTVEEIRRKQEHYNVLVQSNDYLFGRLWADAWCAAFFWKKTNEFAYPITEEVFRNIEKNPYSIPPWMRNEITRLRDQYGFFHWHLAFPDVFRVPITGEKPENEQAGWSGGFDLILGNPPFVGGKKIRSTLGEKYRGYLGKIYKPFEGTADLCAAFYRRAFNLIRSGAILGLVATNTIGQGDTRESGLAQIVITDGTIIRAYRFLKWAGDANIEVNLIAIHKGIWRGDVILDDKPVSFISSRLTDEPEVDSIGLRQNVNKSFIGSVILGGGFVLTPQQAKYLIEKDLHNAECIFPYLIGHDVNSDYEQKPSRWIINFHDWELARAQTYTDCMQIVLEKVKPEREQVNRTNYRQKWWQFGERVPTLYSTIKPLKRVLVRSRLSGLHMLVFVPNSCVFGDALVVFAFDDYYHFALLQSNAHEAWVRRNASTMRSDVRYTPTDCFDNFPFPQNPTTEAKQQSESIGAFCHNHRQQVMQKRQMGLTAIYNLFHNPHCSEVDIAKLRELHATMDCAILTCYGWQDIDLQHNFYQDERGQIRYMVSDAARREILVRLLRINHDVALSEGVQKT